MARGLTGVKADLFEFGRHLLDVACFLPPSVAANYTDSPPASPRGDESANPSSRRSQSRVVAGVLRDLAELGGSLKTGISRLSGAFVRKEEEAAVGGVREEVIQFIRRELVRSPESWLDFSMPLDDDFDMSHSQRDHIAMVEHLAPDLPTLRMSLCPKFMSENRFWKIYFALLLPKLNQFEAEFLSTQLIMEEMTFNLEMKMKHRLNTEPDNAASGSVSLLTGDEKIDTEQEATEENLGRENQINMKTEAQNRTMAASSSAIAADSQAYAGQGTEQSPVRPTRTEAGTLQYFDRWFDSPVELREAGSYTETTRRQKISSREDDSYSETEDGDNIVLLKKYGASPSVGSSDNEYSVVSFNERLPPSRKELMVEETGSWLAGEDSSDFEMVERS